MKKVLFLIVSFSLMGLVFFEDQPILIHSLESKGEKNQDVFNKISYQSSAYEDVWTMRQSHHGLNSKEWDLLKIVIDKTKKPYEVEFFQLDPVSQKPIEYRVSCFNCHSNGPRAIRYDEKVPLNLKEKWTIFWWNLKIKTYGRVVESSESKKVKRKIFFQSPEPFERQTLEAKTCLKCHHEQERGKLTRQQSETIKFMVQKGFMPPYGKLNSSEQIKIKVFISGFM
jgi:hypothetical protein